LTSLSPTFESAAAPLLRVKDLTTRFHTPRGRVHAVNGVSFDVGRGELVGIVGETGCGKSATVRSVLGLIRPPGEVEAGSVWFDGVDLLAVGSEELRRIRGARIGFVAQHPWSSLNPILSIEEQIRNVITAHRKASRAECRELAVLALRAVEIPGPERVLAGYSHELSGGIAQRVVIAIAMILDPDLVIADEPTTALDVTVQRQILDLITHLLSHKNRSMLLVTHDLGVVAQYCRTVVVMYAGKVVESGPVAEIFVDPAHPYTAALLSSVPQVGRPLVPLGGRIPDLTAYPMGCPYAERCPHAFDQCATTPPELRPVVDERTVSCHLDLLRM
jgi:peptide/nickel transport system ATP-binding protein